MSLAFLAKKPWHTATVKNVEKVWIAEQKQEDEAKRVSELKKQIDEEREIDDLRKLQKDQGLVTDPKQKLEWMYEGPGSAIASAAAAEEYKLGREFRSTTQKAELTLLETKKAVGSTWLDKSTTDANEQFVRVNEDPLYKMRRSEKLERDTKVLKNPLVMKRVKQTLANELREYEQQKKIRKEAKRSLKKKLKKEKKDKKKKKKQKRKRHDSSDSSDDSDSDDDSSSSKKKKEAFTTEESKGGEPATKIPGGYGLTKGAKNSETSLGPPSALVEARQEALRPAVRRPKPKLSAQELEERRRDMELDAKAHEDRRRHRMRDHRKSAIQDCLEEDDNLREKRRANNDDSSDDEAINDVAPKFLRQARAEAYGDKATADLADALQRSKNRHQRKAADFFDDD